MCYALLLSTTSEEDLARRNNELIHFEQNLPEIIACEKLIYQQKWYVSSQEGCSCGFRHLYSVELGFGEPVDWYEENISDIEATKQFISIVRELIHAGYKVECIDAWWSGSELPYREMDVNLDLITDEKFRFFENHKFNFVSST